MSRISVNVSRLPDQRLVLYPEGHQVGDGANLDAVPQSEILQLGHADHASIVIHDLADDARRLQIGQPGQVDRGALRLAGPDQHAAIARPQGKDMAGSGEVLGFSAVGNGRQDGVGSVGSRYPCRHTAARLNRDRKRRAERRRIVSTMGGS